MMTEREIEETIHRRAWTGRTPGLARIRRLLDRLGNPQRGLKFVHIAGSNGKGSTAAMLASVLTRAGLRTGLYTSPHLWHFGERFQVDGVPIPEGELGEAAAQVLDAARDETEFELMTAIAMVYFRRAGCQLVVLETGLGGRLDSTNVIDVPEAAVITAIGLEHTQLLGDTLEKIAAEKAGIVKPGGDVVLYSQSREVHRAVEDACRAQRAALTVTACPQVLSAGPEGQRFAYRGRGPYHIALLGAHQLENAALVLETVDVLRRRGWDIPEQAVCQGLAAARWPGRMELVRRSPDLLLDGGHNPQCMQALARGLAELYPGKRLIFLTGVLEDKDYRTMMAALRPLAQEVFTITPDSPRALSARDLAAYLQAHGTPAAPCGSVREGLERALAAAGTGDVVCACGSLYVIGEIRHLLGLV